MSERRVDFAANLWIYCQLPDDPAVTLLLCAACGEMVEIRCSIPMPCICEHPCWILVYDAPWLLSSFDRCLLAGFAISPFDGPPPQSIYAH